MEIPKDHEAAIQASLQYLSSDEALRSIEANPYWPKWHAPWWHMAILFEMGMADRIPKAAAMKLLSEVKRTHLPYFFREDAPKDKTAAQEAPCPCALGNIYQILSATGLDVDGELPWARNWFLKYQMRDGGLNCDEDAYKSKEVASSMVGTIACLEAILTTTRLLTEEELKFLDRGAEFLLNRELRLGSKTEYNAEERLDEEAWLKLCFPRFYLYDVLRGLNFILKWAEVRQALLPQERLSFVLGALNAKAKNENGLKIERHSYEGVGTRFQPTIGTWERSPNALQFPLLDKVSEIGTFSPYLTENWNRAKQQLGLNP